MFWNMRVYVPKKQELSWKDASHIRLHAMPCFCGFQAVEVTNPRLGWQPEETPRRVAQSDRSAALTSPPAEVLQVKARYFLTAD